MQNYEEKAIGRKRMTDGYEHALDYATALDEKKEFASFADFKKGDVIKSKLDGWNEPYAELFLVLTKKRKRSMFFSPIKRWRKG